MTQKSISDVQSGYDRIAEEYVRRVRDPYTPEVEYQSRRAYIFAHKPGTTKTS